VFSTGAHRGIDANTSIGALVDLYLTDLQRDVKLLPQSKERYRQAAMGIRKTWPALPVSELDAGTVVVHLEQLEETSPSGARLCRTVLRKVLRAALRANAVTSNVAWRADVALSVPRKNPRARSQLRKSGSCTSSSSGGLPAKPRPDRAAPTTSSKS
jgi:hypothetical protein